MGVSSSWVGVELFQGRANPGRVVGFRENQVGLSGEGDLNAAHSHAGFDAALTWAADSVQMIVSNGSMTSEDCADQHH
ncbi:hypothetical protein [Pseudomonas rustica]|uniref:hypothetical protein n=1 Tax=Pseudomonas rustica TaxID=2827099 RepID=UPI001FE4A6BA|nr:hypothetical protein [Pseudomonas rustica]